MSKRVLSLILSMVIVIGITAGCSNQKQADSPVQKTEDANMVGNMYRTGFPIVKKPETFKVIYQTPASSKKPVGEKDISKVLEEKTNVKIEWDEIANSAYNEKLQIIFAANQLPDAIMSPLPDTIIMAYSPSLAPLNDLLEKWAPNIMSAAKTQPKYLKTITYPDGKIYSLGLLTSSPTAGLVDRMFINKVWLDKLGLKVPETTDELYTVLTAFKQKDPNGNGKADEIPMGFCEKDPIKIGFLSLFGAFGVLDNVGSNPPNTKGHIMVKNGKVIFTPAEQEYYDGLKYFSKLMKEGLMDMEGFSQSQPQYDAKGKSGIYGMLFCNYPDIQLGDLQKNYITLKPLKGPKGDHLWNINMDGSAVPGLQKNVFTIMKKCESPEVLVRWADYMNSSLDIKNYALFGKENETWKKLGGNKWAMTQEFVPAGMSYAEFRQSNCLFTNAPVIFTADEVANNMLDDRTQQAAVDLEDYKLSFPKEYVSFQSIMDASMNKEISMLLTDINPYIDSFLAKSVLNGITDKEWGEHLNKLKTLNAEKYVKYIQEFYDKQK